MKMKKQMVLILALITFISCGYYFFRNYRKEGNSIRESFKMAWKAAVIIIILIFGPIKNADAKGVDGWQNRPSIHKPSSNTNNGFFGLGKGNSYQSHSKPEPKFLPRFRHKSVQNWSRNDNPWSGLFGSENNNNGGGGGKKPEKSFVDYDFDSPKKAQGSKSKSDLNEPSSTYNKNSHLDRKIKLNDRVFKLKRSKIEKKTSKHGIDLGLEPEIGADGKPIIDKKTNKARVKGNKKNFDLFADKLEEFMKKSEMREGFFRKGRSNEQEAINFYDAETNVVASFNKKTGDFISLWKMDKPGQIDEFFNNNNVI